MKTQTQLLKSPLVWLLLLQLSTMKALEDLSVGPIAKDGCNDTCGNITIPFPFGMGSRCFLDEWFEINCKPYPDNTSKPFLPRLNDTQVLEIEVNTLQEFPYSYPYETINRVIVALPPLNVCSADTKLPSLMDLRGTPYTFSKSYNFFIVVGRSGTVYLLNEDNTIITGCATTCEHVNASTHVGLFNENTCCISDLTDYRDGQFYHIDFNRQGSQNCLVATLVLKTYTIPYMGRRGSATAPVPVALYWSWKSKLVPGDNPNAKCSRSDSSGILTCRCKRGYQGNPYVSTGCQVPEGCKSCPENCGTDPYLGPYTCLPETGPYYNQAAVIGVTTSLGSVFLVFGCYALYHFIRKRRDMKRRARLFKRNGGLLLQQQLTSEGIIERTKIFTVTELDKATDHFNANRILGQGGQGTVYKGMLVDGRIVAIKKSKLLDESQLEQFINEVVILSQINHRNVVKLLGCCLETEVPLLVYEFVPNGTLSQNIHDPDEDFFISWEMRLEIALDSAGAIAYLHSYSSQPIYHRDIKSSNILLDEKNRAKVSDFGSSKTIAIDQSHISTLVQGTMGYLDPEYFQSYQFTDKSDVYSFGVVLLEILTGKKPIYRDENMEQKNLAAEFLYMMETSQSPSFLDPEIIKEAKEEELAAFIELAKRCLNGSRKLRPTMKEIAMTLEMISKPPAHVTPNQEAPMREEADIELVIEDTSDAGDSTSLSTRLSPDATSSAFLDGLPYSLILFENLI